MRTTKLTRFVLSGSHRPAYAIAAAVFLISIVLLAQPPGDPDLKVMKTGLGFGTITSDASNPGIDCGNDCDQGYADTAMVTLTATPTDAASTFMGWSGDCSGMGTCMVNMTVARAVRAEFRPTMPIPPLTEAQLTPDGIAAYLTANAHVNSAARFINALPSDYKQNWILMTRSESLQTGTALSPRILLPGANARNVFTVGATEHSSYPGSHHHAIEYMQWDPAQKNFRFHEIVFDTIPDMDTFINPDMSTSVRFPTRARGLTKDDAKCPKCHSTRNVLNLNRNVTPPVTGTSPATDGISPGTIKAKNKPNWDAYDSWGGMMPFNRDRIYQGSIEAASFRHLLNLWNWRNSPENDVVRQVIEQLELQPSHVGATSVHRITRDPNNVTDEGHIRFGFDSLAPIATTSPSISYSFGGPAVPASDIVRGGRYVTLRHSVLILATVNEDYSNPGGDEGRGVQLFDLLGGLDGTLNQERIADELIDHRYATGNVGIEIRPIVLAISKRCIVINGGVARSNPTITPALPALPADLSFFNSRNGVAGITDVLNDTRSRSQSNPRRKVEIEKINLDRTVDPYLRLTTTENGLIQRYGSGTTAGTDISIPRLRREVFQRPIDLGDPDSVIGGIFVDREDYITNTEKIALLRYFLEPLGVSIDKWSMGVRGRSRTYTFADVFSTYKPVLESELQRDLGPGPGTHPIPGLTAFECSNLIPFVNNTLTSLPAVDDMPTYTDIQRIFNKSCIECHGGLGYPPYRDYGGSYLESLDFSEDESPGVNRMQRSYDSAVSVTTTDPTTSTLYRKITKTGEGCPDFANGMMPCGGPPLSKTDIETIRRWIVGPPSRPFTVGDPHIKTVDGVSYDFQSAGEFVLLREPGLEIQTRQAAVETDSPLGPNGHTGLSSCVSLNSGVAVKVGGQRITYQPNLSGRPDPQGLQLRINGTLMTMTAAGIPLQSGGRIVTTSAPGGIQIEVPGGTAIVITPAWWDHYQVWYMNIDIDHARATEGVMGAIAPENWLPALPDGSFLGPRPDDLHKRYVDLYERFENAWRVSKASTLFDYAPGTSTATFTIENWPEENPRACRLPPRREVPPPPPPLKPLALDVAQKHCQDVVADDLRANCVQDVMVTGEAGFARTYVLAERVSRNAKPTVPQLGFPDNDKKDVSKPIEFTWSNSTDPDGDVVTYRYCVWPEGERFNTNKCEPTPSKTAPSRTRKFVCALLVILVGCVLIAILFFTGLIRRRVLLWLVIILTLAGAILAFYLCGRSTTALSKTVSELEAGKAYYWKVIAEDGKGGTTESETRRFEIKK